MEPFERSGGWAAAFQKAGRAAEDVMEPFECSGVWWLAEEPSARVAGVLRFSPEDGLVLSLVGTLGGGGGAVGDKSYGIILGSVYDSRWGQYVTLSDCLQVRFEVTFAGLSAEDYRAERAFFGRHLTRPEDFLFSQCYLSTSGLSGWTAHRTGFGLEYGDAGTTGGWQFRLNYTPPPALKAQIPGGLLSLFFGAGFKSTLREYSFNEKVAISITATEPLEEDDWNGRFVYPLLNFVTLATDVPNALTRWDLASKEAPSALVKVVGQRVFSGAAEDPGVIAPHRMLLPLEGREEKFPALIARWLDVAEEYRDACNIFFGLWYAPGGYIDMRLLNISQALELYQARRAHVGPAAPLAVPSELLTSLPLEAQEGLRLWAEGVTVDTFPSTLRRLAGEHQTTLAPLAPHRLEVLVDEILKFRNYVLHRNAFPAAPGDYSQGLFLTTETLSCLMKSCLLAELGFTAEERSKLFHRNAMYGFLQSQWAGWKGAH
jgi:hypothetical protein